jgi:LacI family transcriptional regulator
MSTSTIKESGGITQASLARLLGVSQMTVSKALSGHHQVSEATRQKVLAMAQRHGYRVNAAATAMRQGRTNTLALIMSTEPAYSLLQPPLLAGLQQAMQPRDLHLMIATLPDDKLTSEGYIPRILREWHSDGLLINYNAAIPEQMIRLIDRARIPSIWINSKQSVNCVYPDDRGNATLMTREMLHLGHRRIAYVDFTRGAHYSSHDRASGCAEALSAAGLSPRRLGAHADQIDGTMVAAVASALSGEDRPTCLVCYSHREAGAALEAAIRTGLQVPRDLSLALFHDAPYQLADRPVATMLIPEREVGRRAVECLLDRIERPFAQIAPEAIAGTLQRGATLAPPPAS